jgi:hypothetical protein
MSADGGPEGRADANVPPGAPFRRDGGAPPPSSDATPIILAEPDAGKSDLEGRCDLQGSWALQFGFDLSLSNDAFLGVPLVERVAGRADLFARADFGTPAQRTPSIMHPCGARLPDLRVTVPFISNEVFGFYLRDETWESPALPSWPATWELPCADPGCSVNTDPLLVTLGGPSAGNELTTPSEALETLDHDGDGEPAVTVHLKRPPEVNANGEKYVLLPLQVGNGARASRLFLIISVAVQFRGQLENCDTMSGPIPQPYFRLRLADCYTSQGGSQPDVRCTVEQAHFVDQSLRYLGVVTAASWRARRVKPAASCADVRAAWQ